MREIAAILIAVALAFVAISIGTKDADCNWCVATYCAFDTDCPENCHCCIREPDIDGECC